MKIGLVLNLPDDVASSGQPLVEHSQATVRHEIGETHDDGQLEKEERMM